MLYSIYQVKFTLNKKMVLISESMKFPKEKWFFCFAKDISDAVEKVYNSIPSYVEDFYTIKRVIGHGETYEICVE